MSDAVVTTTIPQALPLASYERYRAEIDDAVGRVLAGGHYILGPETEAFEAEFASYLGVRHAVGVASGTDALELALRGVGVREGELVVTVSHTAVATAVAIERAGAVPLFIDIDPETMTFDPAAFEAVLEGEHRARIRAIVPVHLYGAAAAMDRIIELAARNDVLVIEDCAQAPGARFGDRRVGSIGHSAAFSFYPTKNLGAIGDGGLVATDDDTIADRVRRFRQYGWVTRFVSETIGTNSRLDELQAAILRIKLRHLEDENDRRREIAMAYTSGLAGAGLQLPTISPGHVFHQYVVRSPQRDRLRDQLDAGGVGTGIHYPVPIHLQPAYVGRVETLGDLPETRLATAEILSLPMHLGLDDAAVDRIVASTRTAAIAGGLYP